MQVDRVGVIGLGDTGGAVARRLLARNVEVTVYDHDPWKVVALVEAGARPARIPADAAESVDMVFVHMPDEASAEQVLFDCGGVGETLPDGGVVIIASTAGSAFLRSAADRLGALGLNAVEAWLTGHRRSTGDAGEPSTAVLVGCSPDQLGTVTPVLAAVGGDVLHTGPLGSVAVLRRLVTALSAVHPPGSTRAGVDSTVLDRRQVLQVLAESTVTGLAEAPSTARRNGSGPAVLADTVDAVGAAEQDGVQPPSVEGTAAGLLSGPVDGGTSRRDGVPAGAEGRPRDANCLGLAPGLFESVIVEVKRRCHIPLLEEALQCSTPAELVALVNIQLTSGV